SAGNITVNGSLTPFIELGVGFNPELTGRENVFLNGALLGFNEKEMSAMYDDIVSFAELERFMDQKLKNYSSGMQVRLAFSIAIRANSDILVLDEVLAVGDEAFQRKCNNYFEKIRKNKNKTVVLVTHSMESVRKYCNVAILIRNGKVIVNSSPDHVADEYSLDNIEDSNEHTSMNHEANHRVKKPTISAKITSRPILKNTESLKIEVNYRNYNNRSVYPKVVINYSNVPIMAANAKLLYDITTHDTKEHTFEYELPLFEFNKGEANIVVLLVDSEQEVNVAEFGYNNELSFIIKNPKTGEKIGGIMRDLGKMVIKK
ncbi:MAG: ABC transporter ATP-binding protein, partial [Bacteroidia bacterium]|nr:ABC transporter ATP-binding protein [Bacteroidia bacterium]